MAPTEAVFGGKIRLVSERCQRGVGEGSVRGQEGGTWRGRGKGEGLWQRSRKKGRRVSMTQCMRALITCDD